MTLQLRRLYFCVGVMGKQVTSGFFSGLKEAGANLLPSVWGNDASPDNSSGHESDHGIGDMGIDSEKSVRVLLRCNPCCPLSITADPVVYCQCFLQCSEASSATSLRIRRATMVLETWASTAERVCMYNIYAVLFPPSIAKQV